MSAFIDTNVLIRHLTGEPPEMAARASAYLRGERELLLTDLVAAETVYVLESFYEAPREEVAQAMRSLVAFHSVVCVDPALLLRAVEVYETDRGLRGGLPRGLRREHRSGQDRFLRPVPRPGRHDRADRAAAGLSGVVNRRVGAGSDPPGVPRQRGRSSGVAGHERDCRRGPVTRPRVNAPGSSVGLMRGGPQRSLVRVWSS